MNRKIAIFFYLGVCFVLVVLLIIKTITIFTSSIIFAITLVLFGFLSKGFRNKNESPESTIIKSN